MVFSRTRYYTADKSGLCVQTQAGQEGRFRRRSILEPENRSYSQTHKHTVAVRPRVCSSAIIGTVYTRVEALHGVARRTDVCANLSRLCMQLLRNYGRYSRKVTDPNVAGRIVKGT